MLYKIVLIFGILSIISVIINGCGGSKHFSEVKKKTLYLGNFSKSEHLKSILVVFNDYNNNSECIKDFSLRNKVNKGVV